jgi:uncharacterized protein YbaR (Trm112 family)
LFIELIDSLRCPHEHEETWLVAAFNKMNGRYVIEGKLGCPVCSGQFTIEGGVPNLTVSARPHLREEIQQQPADPDDAMRVSAFLNLSRQAGMVLLTGGYTSSAPGIAELTGYRTIAVNPSAQLADSELVASVSADVRLPFAASSIDGIAMDHASAFMHDAARVLKPGGRIVAPASETLPPGLRELARDESYVVAEAVGPLLTLRR